MKEAFFIMMLMWVGVWLWEDKPSCIDTDNALIQNGVEYKLLACSSVGWMRYAMDE